MFPNLLYLWFDSYDKPPPKGIKLKLMNRSVLVISQYTKQRAFSEIQKHNNGRFRVLHDYLYDSSVTPHRAQCIRVGFCLTRVSMAHDAGLSCISDVCVW